MLIIACLALELNLFAPPEQKMGKTIMLRWFYCSVGYATSGAEDQQPPRPPTGVPASGDYILPHTQLELGPGMVSCVASLHSRSFSGCQVAEGMLIL